MTKAIIKYFGFHPLWYFVLIYYLSMCYTNILILEISAVKKHLTTLYFLLEYTDFV